MQVTMKDRVAVVTGGSKGIGLAVARQFVASGAKVAILARGAQDLKAAREALGREGHLLICDVLGAGMSITQAACNRGLLSEADRKYTGKRFRECLSTLAVRFGYANRDVRA